MIHRIEESKQHIIYIMLSGRLNHSPTRPSRPYTLFFSVEEGMPGLCPPIF